MADRVTQVLSLHRITPRCYDLTSVRTGSVRDQMVRATLLAHALIDTGVIAIDPRADEDGNLLDDEQTREELTRLLILGAGVAGVSLALSAAERGANVIVVEEDSDPFSTIRGCYWRTVDPTEYDWPHPHWRTGALPIPGFKSTGPSLPMKLRRLHGAALAGVWSIDHNHVLFPPLPDSRVPHGAGSVTILYGRNANDLTIDDRLAAQSVAYRAPGDTMLSVKGLAGTSPVEVSVNSSNWPPSFMSMRFAAIVSAIGFGDEVTSERPIPKAGAWNNYCGPRFWLDDDGIKRFGFFAALNNAKPTSILISGAGDGAMQDFQRVATGLFGLDLYDKIKATVPGRFAPEARIRDALLAEDNGRRAHGWRPLGSSIEQALEYWHHEFELAVHEVWTSWTPTDQSLVVHTVLRPEVINGQQAIPPAGAIKISWITNESAPSFSYGLNRFLSQLILEMIASLHQADIGTAVSPTFRTRHTITAIDPVFPHTCTCHAPSCYAKQHGVWITDLASATKQREVFDLILIRHGQEPSPLLGGASVPEQQVPFDIPC